MTVHPFGAVSSPSVANFVFKHTGRRFGACTRTTRMVGEDFYVDDILTSCGTESEAAQLCLELRECCQRGGFRLTKFASNKESVLEVLPEEDRALDLQRLRLDGKELTEERTLGIIRRICTDQFCFTICPKAKLFTRRGYWP